MNAHEQHYDQDFVNGNPEADEAYAKAMEEVDRYEVCDECGADLQVIDHRSDCAAMESLAKISSMMDIQSLLDPTYNSRKMTSCDKEAL